MSELSPLHFLFGGVGIAVMFAALFNRSVSMSVGDKFKVTIGSSTRKRIEDIDKAVNSRPPEQPSLYDNAAETRSLLTDEVLPRIDAVDNCVQAVDGKLESHLDWHGRDT